MSRVFSKSKSNLIVDAGQLPKNPVVKYLTGIKKIYVKGESTKFVPRQVMTLTTFTFETNESEVLKDIDTQFTEL